MKFHNMLIISNLPNLARIVFYRPKGRMLLKMRVIRVKRS